MKYIIGYPHEILNWFKKKGKMKRYNEYKAYLQQLYIEREFRNMMELYSFNFDLINYF